jgi:hypothetical protein
MASLLDGERLNPKRTRGAADLRQFRKKRMLRSWMMLAVEANEVIVLRMLKLMAGGRKGRREAERMVGEKIHAALETNVNLMTGASADEIVDRYRQRVAANAKRLSRSKLNRRARKRTQRKLK